MAIDTPSDLRNLTIYQVYIRNHGPNGKFKDLEGDLERISSIGVDLIYLMPIHPIGEVNKKGTLGCPYAITDYRSVNPEYGTEQDFRELVEAIHALGMKVMIDVVFNHSACDARYVSEHPGWYHRDKEGRPYTTVPEWSDIIDLKHPDPELWQYLISTLQQWVRFGVDGFRCDVASLVPLQFWREARQACAAINPALIWLAESVHLHFIRARRQQGLLAHSDSELYQAFDILYDYDIWPIFQAAVSGSLPLIRYIQILQQQESIYPANFIKLRCVENHDQLRIQKLAPTPAQALAWTALAAFNKGPFFIYAGQESAAVNTPSLFERDKIVWGDFVLQPFLTRLAKLKKDQAQLKGELIFIAAESVLEAAWFNSADSLYGVFNAAAYQGQAAIQLPDGHYHDLLSDAQIEIINGKIVAPESAYILRCSLGERPKEIATDILSAV